MNELSNTLTLNEVSLKEVDLNELENINGGSITLAAAIYAGCAVGGFALGVGVSVATVKFLNWIGA